MNEYFHIELDSYKDQVNWYGRFAFLMLKNSLMAFESVDSDVALDVVRQQEYLKNQYQLLQERGILLIALNQPVAFDLRSISCCFDMITSSERVGKYGKDIAELILSFGDRDHDPELKMALINSGSITCEMLDIVYTSFATCDLSQLNLLSEMEDTVDVRYVEIFHSAVSAMEKDTSIALQCSAYHMINKYLERCADHACRMGERIYYRETGKRITIDRMREK